MTTGRIRGLALKREKVIRKLKILFSRPDPSFTLFYSKFSFQGPTPLLLNQPVAHRPKKPGG
jgi:hypothetical protein